MAHLWRYFAQVKHLFLIGVVFLLGTNLLALRIPREVGGAIEHLKQAASLSAIDVRVVEGHALTIAMLAVGAGLARILSRIFIFNAARAIEYNIRGALFSHLTLMDTGWFQRASTGDLVSRITNDVTYVRVFYGFGTLHIVNTTMAVLIVLGLMLGVSWELTIYALMPYPIILLTMRLFTRAIYTRTQATQAQLGEVSARAQENLSGMAVIKAFGRESQEIETFKAASDDYLVKNMALARVRGALGPYMGSVAGIGTLVVLWLGGNEVIAGHMTLGAYVEFSSYVVILSWPTVAMGWVLSVWQRGLAGFDRLLEILRAVPTVREVDDPIPLQDAHGQVNLGDIVIRGVSLTYEDGTQALKDINLRIKAGSRVAVVGRTGSGKSTLVHMLPRLRDPTTGTIEIGGRPLDQVALGELRRQIGYVSQDPFLFSMTVKENVLIGTHGRAQAGGLSLDEAMDIAHMSGDLGALPDGLETLVGERGITLSGGQKQRLTIARAVLTDPRLLILDDALSSVDTATERQILEALDKIMAGRTTLMVTHRFNALSLFDDIVVLDQGRIIERGTHDALIDKGGLYCRLYQQQMAEEVE